MPAEYFEARERALLGERYERLYTAPQETAARGVTVSALRTTPEEFAARADFPLRPSPFCKAAFVVECPDFKPGRHPYHHAGVFYSQEPSASSAAPLLGVRPGMRVLDLCAAPGGKRSPCPRRAAASWLLLPPLCGGRGFWSATNTSRPGQRSLKATSSGWVCPML